MTLLKWQFVQTVPDDFFFFFFFPFYITSPSKSSRHEPFPSVILIQLEAGPCSSIHEMNSLATTCYQARKYSTTLADYCPFYCPRCRRAYRVLSGLVQHVKTTSRCESLLGKVECLGKMERFIAKRVR